MPETKTQRRAPARKAAAPRKRPVESKEPKEASAGDWAAGFSDEVLKWLESGQRDMIEALRKFVDNVDEKLPAPGDEHPSRRKEIIDAALEMIDRLVQAQYNLLRKALDSATSR
ncbi:MAG: hypothetical protein ACHQAV_04615 [Solirubrobacterales bacterium]